MRPWTDEERATLRDMVSEGKQTPAIAKRLNRTSKAVAEKIGAMVRAGELNETDRNTSLRLRVNAWTPEQDQKLLDMARSKVPAQDIADALGRSRRGIYDRMRRLAAMGHEAEIVKMRSDVDYEAHEAGQVQHHAPHVASAIDRARARADQMIAAGTDPRAARNELLQTTGLDVGLRPAGEAASRVLASIKPEAAE